jgi:hypothetical protein
MKNKLLISVIALFIGCNYLCGQNYVGKVFSKSNGYDYIIVAGPYSYADANKYVNDQNQKTGGYYITPTGIPAGTKSSDPIFWVYKLYTQAIPVYTDVVFAPTTVSTQYQNGQTIPTTSNQNQTQQYQTYEQPRQSYSQRTCELISKQSNSGLWSVYDSDGEYVTPGRAYKVANSSKWYNIQSQFRTLECL